MRVIPQLLRIKGINKLIFLFLAFVGSIESMHETNSENESTDEQNVSFLKNIVIEYQCLIKKY